MRLRPPLVGFGLSMIGPTLLQLGTEELKRAHIPPIVRGEIRWCQGYSEPGSGSDLASLQTRAVRRRRRLRRHRTEDLDLVRRSGRLDVPARAHRPRRAQARGHQLPADGHGQPRRQREADQADQRLLAVLRDVPRPRARAAPPGDRRGQQGLDRRQGAARPRAHDDRRHRQGPRRRDPGARRAATWRATTSASATAHRRPGRSASASRRSRSTSAPRLDARALARHRQGRPRSPDPRPRSSSTTAPS